MTLGTESWADEENFSVFAHLLDLDLKIGYITFKP